MAPEVVASGFKEADKAYDSRIDVWALGKEEQELAQKNGNIPSSIKRNKNVMMKSRSNKVEEQLSSP
jgi:hypothetical protein